MSTYREIFGRGLPGDVVRLPVIMGHENLGVVEEIGSDAAKAMVMEGPPLEVGERVYIAADIKCGQCYNCRNIYGFPWCLNHTSYGDVISCDKPPHLFGGYSEKMYLLPKSDLFRVPKNLPNEIAVLAEQMAVAYGGFRTYVPESDHQGRFLSGRRCCRSRCRTSRNVQRPNGPDARGGKNNCD